ncbi:broad-complex core protein isoforms 1/2/3/4/5 isoform X2 [Plutella xylostella]|uniref:broad-complex core protein isoforms 1/2/3/4/5 isoform X2 n=1 Tax=Plutella xylostella TaxID=51655 RepID=UPI0018D16AED|nr:broad-complex core protein isoforms 1/2/3/4/5 isoform X2 [Plutella xylostella]
MEGTELGGDQQFCLRWNNFQANITSQFEALRDDEDFVDVTLACEGHRLEAHKVVLSACSPYFKELFKNNPCPHPIIFMRDCEVSHVRALLQFMYVGQVNIAQAQLSAFLRTADALQIRGLTDCSQHNDAKKPNRKSPPSQLRNLLSAKPSHSTSASKVPSQNESNAEEPEKSGSRRSERNSPDVARNNLNEEAPFQTSSQTRPNNDDYSEPTNYPHIRVKTDLEAPDIKNEDPETLMEGADDRDRCPDFNSDLFEPKMEMMEQEASDEEKSNFPPLYYNDNNALANPFAALQGNVVDAMGAVADMRDDNIEVGRWESRRTRPVPDAVWLEQHRRALPFVFKRENERGTPAPTAAPRLIKLGEGVEIREELLRGVKWGDYRKVTRGLAAALFSPFELATCSVTGQRWSRAGQESRPTKPPLDRRRVHALISYVSRQFPDVEVSRIKQVLAYKCKENCAALRMRTASESSNFLVSGAPRPPPCDDPALAGGTSRAYHNYESSKPPSLGEGSSRPPDDASPH